jgi:hypothetical protein
VGAGGDALQALSLSRGKTVANARHHRRQERRRTMAYETVPGGAASHRSQPTAFRSDSIDIPLGSPQVAKKGSDLEYKVRMKAGDSLVYSWTVSGLDDPQKLHYDLHGELPTAPGSGQVVEYIKGHGAQSHGTFTAPIPGVHGWYLQNLSARPLVVHLKLSGFYELVPPGEYGNQAGIVANVPHGQGAKPG